MGVGFRRAGGNYSVIWAGDIIADGDRIANAFRSVFGKDRIMQIPVSTKDCFRAMWMKRDARDLAYVKTAPSRDVSIPDSIEAIPVWRWLHDRIGQ